LKLDIITASYQRREQREGEERNIIGKRRAWAESR